ncbi:unnamed protein product [Linum tenue]|nr:unnamed protein product [Linum tenue]
MAEMAKVLYIVVVDEEERRDKGRGSFRYTRPVLQGTLQLMGCKARHAFKISRRVFEIITNAPSIDTRILKEEDRTGVDASRQKLEKSDVPRTFPSEKNGKDRSVPFELYKRRTTLFVRRGTFLDVVCDALAEYKYVGPNQRADLVLACR